MKEENLHPWIEPDLEARIVALVLGEASDFEREELERLKKEQPELGLFQNRIAAVHDLLRENTQGEVASKEDEWRLSPGRRSAVLSVLSGDTENDESAPVAAPDNEGEVPSPAERPFIQWKQALTYAAACLIIFFGALNFLPIITRIDSIAPASFRIVTAHDGASITEESNLSNRSTLWASQNDTNSSGAVYDFAEPPVNESKTRWSMPLSYSRKAESETRDDFGIDLNTDDPQVVEFEGFINMPERIDPVGGSGGRARVVAKPHSIQKITEEAMELAELDVEDIAKREYYFGSTRKEGGNASPAAGRVDNLSTGLNFEVMDVASVTPEQEAEPSGNDAIIPGLTVAVGRGGAIEEGVEVTTGGTIAVTGVANRLARMDGEDKALKSKEAKDVGGRETADAYGAFRTIREDADGEMAGADSNQENLPGGGKLFGNLEKDLSDLKQSGISPGLAGERPQASGTTVAGTPLHLFKKRSDAPAPFAAPAPAQVEDQALRPAPLTAMPASPSGPMAGNLDALSLAAHQTEEAAKKLFAKVPIVVGGGSASATKLESPVTAGADILHGGVSLSVDFDSETPIDPSVIPSGPKEAKAAKEAKPDAPVIAGHTLLGVEVEDREAIELDHNRAVALLSDGVTKSDDLLALKMKPLQEVARDEMTRKEHLVTSTSSAPVSGPAQQADLRFSGISQNAASKERDIKLSAKQSTEEDGRQFGFSGSSSGGIRGNTATIEGIDESITTAAGKGQPSEQLLSKLSSDWYTSVPTPVDHLWDDQDVKAEARSEVRRKVGVVKGFDYPTDYAPPAIPGEEDELGQQLGENKKTKDQVSRVTNKGLGLQTYSDSDGYNANPLHENLGRTDAKITTKRDTLNWWGESTVGSGATSDLAAITNYSTSLRRLEGDLDEQGKSAPPKAALAIKIAPPAGLEEIEAKDESFSTFSLHVSDVSFKLAQAALEKGEWPDSSRIRIEEFVNALDYGDPMPTQSEKVACQIEQATHPFFQQRNLLRVSMRTAAAGRSASTPLRLTFLLDNSGSMERSDRQETVQRAFALLTDQLQPEDQVTLISFARQPRLLADQVGGENANELVETVKNLPSEGGTNLEAALELAYEKATEQQLDKAQNRIILLTDGAANLGDAEPESLSRMIESMRDNGIAFDAAGIGADGLNDEILEALTRKGDGRYYLLDRPEDADSGFASQIAGALRPTAKNVKVQIEFNPDRVGKYKLLGFEKHRLNKEDFRDDTVDAAEMAAEEAGIAVYQIEPKADGEGDIGFASVRFRDLETDQMVEKRWPILYHPNAPRPDQAAPSMRIATAASQFAAYLKGGPAGDMVDLREIAQLVANLPDRYNGNERVQQLRQMIDQARNIAGH